MTCIDLANLLRVTEGLELGSISIQKTGTRYNTGLTSVGTETTKVCAMGDKLFYVEKICMNANENRTMRCEQ
jgi:hypothetical protein